MTKKIMFYVNALNGGGAERVMTNLSSQFADNGYETVFVTSYKAKGEYSLNEKIKRLCLEEGNSNTSRVRRNLYRIKKLRSFCKTEKPDVLIAFMGEPNFRAVLATIGLKTKTIISVRNDPDFEYSGRLMRFIGKHVLKYADGCVFQTEDAKKWFPNSLQNKSRIIFNAVKSEFYETERVPEYGCIVTCGRLQKQKNQKLLIDAVNRLLEKHPMIRLKIYGEGVLENELRQYICDLGRKKNITLEGQTDNVPNALKCADIFVLPSDFEGMPNALMEALAMGIPSISTDCPCGGPRMLIRPGENGELFPVNDVDRLTECLDRLLRDEALKKQYSDAAKRLASNYTADKIFCQWEEYIKEL